MGVQMQLDDRIGRRMKLQDLHVLMAVVHAGSMSKGAALLNTTQSAISRSIAELEHTIGVRLTVASYSNAARPCSMNCARALGALNFSQILQPGKCELGLTIFSPRASFRPLLLCFPAVILALCFISWPHKQKCYIVS